MINLKLYFMKKKIIFVLTFFLLIYNFSFISYELFAQSITEPIYNGEIYKFLDHQSQKGVIDFFDDIRPITRIKIAKEIIKINKKKNLLSNLEKKQLEFFKKEYAFELKYLKKDIDKITEVFTFGKTNRFNTFKYYDENFTFKIDPIFLIEYNFLKENYKQFGGIQLSGRISNNFGYYLSYRDFMEDGKNIDNFKKFTFLTGVKNHRATLNKRSEYSETRGGINYSWSWGDLRFAKDFLNIGSSYEGSVIFSNKAPSVPHINYLIETVNWFKYNFTHAWLDSKIIDSTTIRNTGVIGTKENRSRTYSQRAKYYVGHSFSFQPFFNWWLTFGESIIYGDRIEPIYFLPLFLRLADHYNSIGLSDSGDNAQLYFNTSYTSTKIKSKFYFTLFIDELSLTDLLTGTGNNASVLAYTLGGRIINPFWQNSYLTIEYNAIKPYAYMNADPLHQYSSSDYQLGHWIGSNAEQYFFKFEQYFTRAIKFDCFFQYIRKGSKENLIDYYNREISTYPLLSGIVSNYSEAGASFTFNPYHDFYFQMDYNYIFKADERFKNEYQVKEGAAFSTSIRYGF